MTIRILLADDHAVVRQGLKMFLSLDDELEIVGEAQDGAEAVKLAHELQPDVVLMDLLMPVMDGITAIGKIRKELPDIEVIALTSVLEDASVVGAVRAGAIGYLLKNTESDQLRRAIKAASQGQVQLSPEAAARLMREMRQPEATPEPLTDREIEVLGLLARARATCRSARRRCRRTSPTSSASSASRAAHRPRSTPCARASSPRARWAATGKRPAGRVLQAELPFVPDPPPAPGGARTAASARPHPL
jgi:DNA-binding NarL/FixJ family response regulator